MRWFIHDKRMSKCIVNNEAGAQEEIAAGCREVTAEEWDAFQTRGMLAAAKQAKKK